jgi:adenine-specific DNA-methyltransferase
LKHDFAKKLRREQTDVERKLWLALRNRQFHGCKFRRQQPVGPYVADFVCFESQLIIELDGGQHGLNESIVYDQARTRYLEKDGFQVLRFFNRELNDNFDGVLEAIEQRMRK